MGEPEFVVYNTLPAQQKTLLLHKEINYWDKAPAPCVYRSDGDAQSRKDFPK